MIESYRVVLKQNMATFMYILGQIIENNTDKGIQFLVDKLLMSKMQCFEYNYRFNALGQIIDQSDRNITDSTRKEFERFVRIAIESVYDYNDKENRNFKVVLSNQEQLSLNLVCSSINLGNIDYAWNELLNLIQAVQLRLINSL